MNRPAPDPSKTQSDRIDRVRQLLDFDVLHTIPEQPRRFAPAPPMTLPLKGMSPESWLRLVGFDEAGRGALAGPVTVACVHFDLHRWMSPDGTLRREILETYAQVNDSKKVSERARERLCLLIQKETQWGIGHASATEIDRIGIAGACSMAARRAYRRLGVRAEVGLFDRGLGFGKSEGAPLIPTAVQFTRGDARSFHIAAASILAKVCRDAIMRELGSRTGIYGFSQHKGYGTAAHFEAIQKHGPSRFHRHTFLP